MNIEFGNNIRTWNLVCGLAIFAMLVIAVFDLVAPKPDANRIRNQRSSKITALQAEVAKEESRLEMLKSADPNLWEGDMEDVTPKLLEEASRLCANHNVNLKSFRPQNPVSDGETIRANYVMLVDGSFPQVAALIRAMDSSASRIGLSLVQISSADQESDKVNATLGVIAYLKAPEPPKKAASNREQGGRRGEKE